MADKETRRDGTKSQLVSNSVSMNHLFNIESSITVRIKSCYPNPAGICFQNLLPKSGFQIVHFFKTYDLDARTFRLTKPGKSELEPLASMLLTASVKLGFQSRKELTLLACSFAVDFVSTALARWFAVHGLGCIVATSGTR